MRHRFRELMYRVRTAGRATTQPRGPFATLKIALVADELTRSCLAHECQVLDVTPANFARVLRDKRPDLLFVESAWQGHRDAWKYRIAAYPDHPERGNADLAALVACARDLGIPAVFWNKEDGVHFERFIGSARLFDTIFTVDQNCLPRYREAIAREIFVAPLMFAVAPAFHHFSGFEGRLPRADFVGSYGWHVHDRRRERQDMLLGTAAEVLGLDIYDRNSGRRTENHRYPQYANTLVRRKVPHEHTGAIYKRHLVSLNVNTVEDSPTMFSRRLVEIMACGGMAVTTPARSVDAWFRPYCQVCETTEQAHALFERLKREGYRAHDREMMVAAAQHVATHHTYTQRLETILDAVHLGRR